MRQSSWSTCAAVLSCAVSVQAAEMKYCDVPRGALLHDVAADPNPDAESGNVVIKH